MNWKALGSYLSKITFAMILLFLCVACQKEKYHLDIYYAKTCPVCRSLMNTVIDEVKDKYEDEIKVRYHDIDEEASRDCYAKTCSLLEDYYLTEDSGEIPFLVFDGYFAKVGYNIVERDEILKLIDDVVQGQDISTELSDFYYFKEGQTLY